MCLNLDLLIKLIRNQLERGEIASNQISIQSIGLKVKLNFFSKYVFLIELAERVTLHRELSGFSRENSLKLTRRHSFKSGDFDESNFK